MKQTDNFIQEYMDRHYIEIYVKYCEAHPEEIHSDFELEDANEEYVMEIIEEMLEVNNE